MSTLIAEPRVRPIAGRAPGALGLGILLAAGTAYWLFQCYRVLTEGLTSLGIDTYGATWGILVANTVHVIGISHVGIAISAAVRILGLERYRNIARPAEIVTLIALVTAFVNLLLHVGRPDRFIINVVLFGKWHSPMVWSMTVFVLYFLASAVYLYLSMRRDLWAMSSIAPRMRGVYRFLAAGYDDSPGTQARHDRTLFWLALCLLPIMISVHSVYGLLFGMLSAKAGWYNPLQAPYFVLGAIVSGFSAITVIAALLRRAYSWQTLLTDRLFRVFGIFLAFVVFLYLYFMLSEHLTSQYLPTTADKAISDAVLSGRFALLFWTTTVVGLILPFVFLLVQGVRRGAVHVGLTATAALLINVALWLKRILIVVPSQYHPQLTSARPTVLYVPTYTEWAVTLGSYVAASLAFILLLRFLPMFELPSPAGETVGTPAGAPVAAPAGATGGANVGTPVDGRSTDRSALRRVVMLVSLVVGLLLIGWGVATRTQDFAPAKWLVGMTLLVAIPLERCLIGGRPAGVNSDAGARRPAGANGDPGAEVSATAEVLEGDLNQEGLSDG